jgi:16S rRNA (guanine(966)-N(2))-methyltransferase RsmD
MSGSGSGKIRIVSGSKRGQRISVPLSPSVRPTSDKVREAVFDVLGDVLGLRALDLFAGSGAMGLEALSRGAGSCVFVESDPKVAATLRGNISSLGYQGVASVLGRDYRAAVAALARGDDLFDLLFVDPPYRMLAEVEETLTPMVCEVVSPDGILVVEGPKSCATTFGLVAVFERVYGDTKITMLKGARGIR